MKQLTIGIIGLGYWGPHILRNAQKIPNIHVKYGSDLLKKNLTNASLLDPSIVTTTNYHEILQDNTIDAVIISTPSATHFEIAKDALQAGKHVLLEKPCTTKSMDAKKLVRIAEKKNLTFMASFPFVYSEPVKKIKHYISKNQLGKLYYYDSNRVNLGIIREDIDVIWDLAIHDLSILQYLLDETPQAVMATGSQFLTKKQTEIAHISLLYPSGFIAQINVSWISPLKIRTVMLGGSKKMVVFNDIDPVEKIKIYEKGIDVLPETPLHPVYRSGDTLSPHLTNIEPLENELHHFFRCIQTNTKPLTSGEKAVEILRALEALKTSLQTHKQIKIT